MRGIGQSPHRIHTTGIWAYATPINPQAAGDINTTLSIQQTQTQRGYTIWWAYQDHDTLFPEPGHIGFYDVQQSQKLEHKK